MSVGKQKRKGEFHHGMDSGGMLPIYHLLPAALTLTHSRAIQLQDPTWRWCIAGITMLPGSAKAVQLSAQQGIQLQVKPESPFRVCLSGSRGSLGADGGAANGGGLLEQRTRMRRKFTGRCRLGSEN